MKTRIYYKNMRFQAAPDSATPEMQFRIIETGLKDPAGFAAVRLQYSDGGEEVAAVLCLEDGIRNCGLKII